jgi:hypothetical protein
VRKPYQILDALPLAYQKRNPLNYKGACTHCGAPASKSVHFKQEGIIVVERYCEACIEPAKFEEILKWYARFG